MPKKQAVSRFLIFIAIIFLFALLLSLPFEAKKEAKNAVFFCLQTLIPSLFLFFALSSLLLSFGIPDIIIKPFEKFMPLLFYASRKTATPFLLGLFAGFPIGAKAAVELYNRGEISKGDCEKALTFSNNPSVGFLISAVGVGVFGSIEIGWLLFAIQTISMLLSAMIGCRIFKFDFSQKPKQRQKINNENALQKFIFAVKSGGESTLNASAFVLFFSVISNLLKGFLPQTSEISALFSGFFEICGGVFSLNSSLQNSLFLCSVILAWSGLSVHCQVISTLAKTEISPKPYLFTKLLSTIISPLIVLFIVQFL